MSTPARPGTRVVVIGAGLSGLSAALWLRGAQCEVTVLDRASSAGGLVRTEVFDGSAFDTGATVLTMPELIEEALGAVGIPPRRARERLALTELDPTYLTRFADGTEFAVPRNPTRLAEAAESSFGAGAGAGITALLHWLQRLYDVEMPTFIDRSLTPGALLSRQTLVAATQLVRMGAVRGLTRAISSFIADPRLRRIFTFQALYAGVPPDRAAAIYAVIAHMDIGLGVYSPRGGMGRVGAVMAEALTEAGGRVRLSTEATEIVTEGGSGRSWRARARRVRKPGVRKPGVQAAGVRVTGVRVRLADGRTEFVPADAVITTTPLATTATLLSTDLPRGPRWRGLDHSPSAVVIHGRVPAARTATWPGDHHTIDFGAAWRQTFVDITRSPGQPMRDPSFLITRPAFSDADTFYTERDGIRYESVSVLAPTPNLETADLAWDSLSDAYVAECLGILARRGYPGIDTDFEVLAVDHPGTWAAAGLPAGTPFGAAHTVGQTGPLRTPNRWPGLDTLILAGDVTNPGVGIPPVLISGRLAAEQLLGAAALAEVRSR